MLKSRPAGKPARLAGSGRKLIRTFTDAAPLNNECIQASKEICLGLAVFRATFGCDDDKRESPLFHGFSPYEIRLATDKSQIRTNQVEREHRARGVLFTPYTPGKCPLLPVSSLMTSSRNCTSDVQTYGKIKSEETESDILPVVDQSIHKRNKVNCFVKSTKKNSEKDRTVNTEFNSRSIARKFVLPVRSAHSSRVIKPNKRFRDTDVAASRDMNDDRTTKRIKLETSSDHSTNSWMGKRTEEYSQTNSDTESNDTQDYWSSSMSTTSSSVKDEDFCTKTKGKVILRKAKLKVEPNPPAVKGPFSSGAMAIVPQKVLCGVCGAVRYYRYLKQTRKFGIYSCEPCRKFITRVMHQNSSDPLICKIGKGECVIPKYSKDPVSGVVSPRCKACWLKMCLRGYCMPKDLKSRLTERLPLFMRCNIPSHSETKPKRNPVAVEEDIKVRHYTQINSSNIPGRVSDKIIETQIILAKSIRRKAEALARKETKQEMSKTYRRNKLLNVRSQTGVVSKKIPNKCKLDSSKINAKRKTQTIGSKSSVKLNLKLKRTKKDKIKREEKLVRLHKLSLKGPRVKHVCRSASLVLGQPVATFTGDESLYPYYSDVEDTSPSKQKSCSSGKDLDCENLLSSSRSGINREECSGYSNLKNAEQGVRMKQAGDNENESNQSGKNKSLLSKPMISDESSDIGLLDGRARTLQDLTRQHNEIINGKTNEDDVALIAIDFWESYDPEEVCKTGFALIGIGDTFNTKAVCFLCGSAGLDKLIHCACCCEPYHFYCVEGGGSGGSGADWWLVDWVCPRCTLCHTCGAGGGTQVVCQKCRKSYHTECLTADRIASGLHSADRPWVCQTCLCCRSCNQSDVYKFVGNLPLCRVCFKLRQKGNFCPLCQRCYDENDFDTKMMECERCKCWVHAKCEGLSNEKYQILSILPDSVEFVCRKCCTSPPALWWEAVEKEMKAGFLAVLKSLSKNRKACDLLKWSPTKRSTVCLCTSDLRPGTVTFPVDLSEQSDAESLDMRVQNEDLKDETVIVEEECLKNSPSNLKESMSSENVVCDSKNEPLAKLSVLSDLRMKYNVRECSVLMKNDDLQLKLDSDTISYQNTDEKPSQFSPHATSQSDSGIGSTDDELKSSNDQCFCMGLDRWTKAPLTLLTIKKKINLNEYLSLDQFNKEMEEMINSVQCTELLKLYYQTLEDTFPWFNPKCSEIVDSSKRINHTYDTKTLKPVIEEKPDIGEVSDVLVTLEGKLNRDCNYYYNINYTVDNRICILCKTVGEGNPVEEGRLLYCGQNEWVHTNCALWSNEVFEEIDGSLQNVQSAISRSRHIRCSKCNKKGASVGCCNRSCPEAYHFRCAWEGECIFLEDKSLFCANHKNDIKTSRVLEKGSDFLVSRPVYVELERKKKKYIAKHNVHITIGSLTINSIGEFVPELSDQECSIVPCNFQCTRMFWSSVEPWRLIQYSIKTKIVYTISEVLSDDDNFTIDHSLAESVPLSEKQQDKESYPKHVNMNEIKEVVEYIVDVICSRDEEDPQASTDFLSPELEEAIFEDLPHDLLDGISVQDIFPKLLNFDSTASDLKSDKEPKLACNDSSKPYPKKNLSLKLKSKSNQIQRKLQSQSSLSLRKQNKSNTELSEKIDNYTEAKQNNKWNTLKILQIDGTGDCSSESNDSSSSLSEESYIPVTPNQFTYLNSRNIFKSNTEKKPHVLLVDVHVDSDFSNSSESPEKVDKLKWKLQQVDGASDFSNGKESDVLEENPVKCTQCHRTYRTAQSFDRHLQTCSADYIFSCSESDSSEEEKNCNVEMNLNGTEVTVPNVLHSKQLQENNSEEKPVVNCITTNVETLQCKKVLSQFVSSNNVSLPPNVMAKNEICTNSKEHSLQNQFPANDYSKSFNCNLNMSQERSINTNISQQKQNYSSKPKTIRAMFDCDDSVMFHLSHSDGKKSPVKVRPMKTYSRKKKTNTLQSNISELKPSHPESLLEYQASTNPAVIIQQMPSHNVLPSYIENLPHQTSNNFQYQYITTIDVQDKPQIPLTIQLQPPISIQPVMPTVLGTLIQPNGVEQLVVNTPAPVEVLNQQPTNVFITSVNQPMYVGMETVVSNTVMSSSQFVSGMLTGSSYSATTTQVFQTAKPVIDLPQSYVVVNAQSNPVSESLPQTIYSSHTPQPWAYNYQETYKVKERTTYQQVTRQVIQDQSNVDCVKLLNSSQEAIILQKPIVQEVMVEKMHSIHKTGPMSSLPAATSNINPVLMQGGVTQEQLLASSNTDINYSPEQTSLSGWDRQEVQKQYISSSLNNSIHTSKHLLLQSNKIEKIFDNPQNVTSPENKNQQHPADKPVITKIKSNANIKNSNFCVTLTNPKVSHLNEMKSESQNPHKNDSQLKNELVEIPIKRTEFSSSDNIIKSNSSVKLENSKKLDDRKSLFKENKAVSTKNLQSLKSVGLKKQKSGSRNLSNPKLVYEISSQDGISISSQDLAEAWQQIFEAVQAARAAKRLPPLPHNPFDSNLKMLGLDNNSVKYVIEQLPGVGKCRNYKPVYHKSKLYSNREQLQENSTGCARSEAYSNTRRKYDMFSWLASIHRRPPKLVVNSDTEIVNGISRRATSLNLPMAMRFRHLKETSKEAVGVFRSDIHGRGLFCLRDIDSGEMVIEYAGEVIRAGLTDKRENYYTSKGIGCYMFRIDDHFVVDATMHGNAARFINHSCEPNCYSRVVDILGKKHILIFALRKIPQGEELTYDYKFPLEDDKITCHCLSRKCRKYLN